MYKIITFILLNTCNILFKKNIFIDKYIIDYNYLI